MTNIREVLAKNMKAHRRVMGLSQAKLAERVGTSTHYIGMIETKKHFPSPEMLERIAGALGIDTVDLFSMEKELIQTIKDCRQAVLKDIKTLTGQFIDNKLEELEKEA